MEEAMRRKTYGRRRTNAAISKMAKSFERQEHGNEPVNPNELSDIDIAVVMNNCISLNV